MLDPLQFRNTQKHVRKHRRANWWPTILVATLPLLLLIAAYAQNGGSPFDNGFTELQTLFTGTVARVASLIAIVIGGYQFAHGEPGAKNPWRGSPPEPGSRFSLSMS